MEELTESKRKRGSKSASVVATMSAKPEEIKRIIGESLQFVPDFKQVQKRAVKTDEECADRLNLYFATVHETGQIPTVEDMALALGVHRQTIWDWEHGSVGNTRSYMIKQAKQILSAIDAKLVQENKIPQVTYIFRAKNYYGMKDQQDVVITPNNPLGEEKSKEELARKYAEITYNLDDEEEQ